MPRRRSAAKSATKDRFWRERRVIAAAGGERGAIPIFLENAWLLSLPTCPELDEPVEAAKARAERMRALAVRTLRVIYTDQKERGEVDERIRRFFAEQAELRIWCSDDPIEAIREFLGRPRRGAPRRNAMRDLKLAAEIQEIRETGKTVNEACTILCTRLQEAGEEPDEEYLKKLYYRETRHPVGERAVRAWVKRRALRRGE